VSPCRKIFTRLFGRRARGETVVAVEATLRRRLAPDRWSAFMRLGKRLAVGDRVVFGFPEDRLDSVCGLNRSSVAARRVRRLA
jgi:S-adenosylmethionine:tRNA ribosyltransferase-isomerase